MTRDDEDDADDLNNRSCKPDLNHPRRQLPALANLSERDKDSIRDQKLNAEDDEDPERIPLPEVIFLLGKHLLEREILSAFSLWKMPQVLGQRRGPSRSALDALLRFAERIRLALYTGTYGFFGVPGPLFLRHLRLL
jgi:hypothetical protein